MKDNNFNQIYVKRKVITQRECGILSALLQFAERETKADQKNCWFTSDEVKTLVEKFHKTNWDSQETKYKGV